MRTKLLFAFALLSTAAFGQQNPIQIDANGLTQTLTAGGVVTRGQIVKINSAGQVVPVLTTDTSGAIGVAATSQTSAGNGVSVSIQGTPLVQIDSSGCAQGNIVSISSTTGGVGHCATTVLNQQIGIAISISSPGSNFWNVQLSFGGGGVSSLGAAVNVKSLGAVGNGKFFVDGVSNASNNQLTSATAVFSASDANQNLTCVALPLTVSAVLKINSTVASFVNSSTITYNGANAGAFSGMYCALTNPADPAAILSAFNACKSSFNPIAGNGHSGQSPACNVYLPAGIYGINNTLNNLISSGAEGCVGIIGDGSGKSALIPTGSFVNAGVSGLVINEQCQGGLMRDFSVEMASIPFSASGGVPLAIIAITGSSALVQDVAIYDHINLGGGVIYGISSSGSSNVVMRRPQVISGGSVAMGGLFLSGGQSNVYSPFLSNTTQNLLIQNAASGANGAGTAIYGGVIDEGSVTSITGSQDVWLNGVTLTGGANCLSIDATSFVWLTGGYCGTFGGNTGGGVTVASGGVLNMTQVHVNAVNGGSSCYTSAAYGGIVDDGTNRCTTSGGGTVYPSGGVVNKTSLSHLPFNAFQTGTLATTTNLQTFVVDQPVAIQTFSWTPNNAFACTAGSFPTFSMSDGTVTVTTAATDTSVSGTVTHTFPNTTASILNPAGAVGAVLTVKVVTTGTCGTAPTNVNINIWGQATAPGL